MIPTVTAAEVHGPECDVPNGINAVFNRCSRHGVSMVFHAHLDFISISSVRIRMGIAMTSDYGLGHNHGCRFITGKSCFDFAFEKTSRHDLDVVG